MEESGPYFLSSWATGPLEPCGAPFSWFPSQTLKTHTHTHTHTVTFYLFRMLSTH